MEAESAVKIQWELTENALNGLLAALAEDRSQAGKKYLLLCKNLQRYFEVRGFSASQSAADEVINRLARKLESGQTIENVNTYALGIARLYSLELRRSPEQKTSGDLPELSVPPVEQASETDQNLVCLDKCLNEIPAEKKEIIVGYYRGERREKIENRRKMAEKLGLRQNALRSRAVRLREKLASCIRKCLQTGGKV